MFMGQYEHSIDAKGRIIIPAKYREELGDTFVVTRGLDGCLFLYPQAEWAQFVEKLQLTRIREKFKDNSYPKRWRFH